MLKLPVKSPIVNGDIDLSEYAKKSDVDAIDASLDNKADKKEVEKISSQLDNSNAEVAAARNGFETLGKRLDGVDSQLDKKANEINNIKTEYAKKTDVKDLVSKKAEKNDLQTVSNELNIQKARIDTFTKLAEGSTTGDAELIDARVGANGVVYNTLGDAHRAQFASIDKLANTSSCKFVNLIEDANLTDVNKWNCEYGSLTISNNIAEWTINK